MLKRPEDGAVLRKKAREQIEILYDILLEERRAGDHQTILQAPGPREEAVLSPLLREAAGKAAQVLKYYEKPVNRAIGDLRIAENGLLWLFASKKKKQRAFASYRYLTDALELGLGPAVREIREQIPPELLKSGKRHVP